MADFKPKVLVVDDEAAVRGLMVTLLRISGIEAIQCSHAAEAEELMGIHGESIQLLLTDVNLHPDLGGAELARSLQSRYARLRVLFVSGQEEEGAVEEEVQSGRAHFLLKPFTPKALTRVVASILEPHYRLTPGDPVL